VKNAADRFKSSASLQSTGDLVELAPYHHGGGVDEDIQPAECGRDGVGSAVRQAASQVRGELPAASRRARVRFAVVSAPSADLW
jgi:hypothetical protein